MAVRADLARRAPQPHDVGPGEGRSRPRRRRARRARGARRRGLDRVDLVRGRDALGPVRRPTTRRDAFPHLHLGTARGRAGDPGAGPVVGPRHVERAGRLPVGQALRRVPRRHVLAGDARHAQPHAPRLARGSVAARARHQYDIELELEAMSWTFEAGHRIRLDLAGTRLAERLVAPRTGHAHDRSGHRDAGAAGAGRARSRRRATRWSRRPTGSWPTPLPRNSPRTTRRRGGSCGTWRTISCGTRPSPSAGSMGDYDADPGSGTPSFRELYGGEVTVSTDDPGIASVTSRGAFDLRFPEATCSSRVDITVDQRSQTHYHVAIDLRVSEDGEERWRRRWDQRFPRDLAYRGFPVARAEPTPETRSPGALAGLRS